MAHRHTSTLTTLPDDYTRVLLIELKAAAKECSPLFARYGGMGMEPFLRNGKDRVNVQPVTRDFTPLPYDILAIEREERCIFRRFVRMDGDRYVVLGDACRHEEQMPATAVIGVVTEVQHADGSHVLCSGTHWLKKSGRKVRARRRINRLKDLFDGKRAKYWSAAYFLLLLMSMWLPLANIAVPDNLIFGLRPDHLFHASIYLVCPFFLYILQSDKHGGIWNVLLWLAGIAIGMTTEFGQKLLPYRSFDVNDLLANAIGVTLGWAAVMICGHVQRRRPSQS